VDIALDYFDASINRVSAWTVGFRNLQKALLYALLTPHEDLKKLQDEGEFSELMVRQEELKTMAFGEIWNEYCRQCGVPEDGKWFDIIRRYEAEVQSKRA
jgi:L-rhamnose isomerase